MLDGMDQWGGRQCDYCVTDNLFSIGGTHYHGGVSTIQ